MHRKPLRTYGKNRPDSSSKVLFNFLRRIYDTSDDSDDDLLEKNNRNVSIKNDTLESTFDRISKDVKLPPMPSDNNENDSKLYINSSSSSSNDENWMQMIEKSPKVPAKKITYKRRKKSNDNKMKNNIDLKKAQTLNRKRQNKLQDKNKDEMENIEPSLPPKRKVKRAIKALEIPEKNSISDEIVENKYSIASPKISNANNNSDDDKNSYSPVINQENINYNDNITSINNEIPSISIINQQNDNFSSIKDCRIVLPRLEINSPSENKLYPINDSKMLMSSTPFFHRTVSKITATFSPIENNESNETFKIDNKDETYKNDKSSVKQTQTFDDTLIIDDKNIEIIKNKTDLDDTQKSDSSSEDSYHLVISNSPEKNNSNNSSSDIVEDKIINSENEIKIDEQINTTNILEPFVLLTRLNDPVKITHRRDKYSNWDNQLGTIIESFEQRSSISLPEVKLSLDKINVNDNKNSPEEIQSIKEIPRYLSNYNDDGEIVCNKTLDSKESKIVFLKPGKLWARSLSILNHINNNNDIDTLSIGKGKKWRQSVKNILDMQSKSGLQSCVRFNECDNEKKSLSNGIYKNCDDFVSSSVVTGNVESTSPGRFIRRVSIRVVPDDKYSRIEDNDVKDTSFLEVYGIPTSKNRQTFGKKLTSIGQRDTLVYNSQHTNANIADISIESVDTAKNVVLQRCNQAEILAFDECYPESFLEKCRKIGEGVYGEVFLFESKLKKSVIKIIPIEGEKLVNGETQKKYSEILSEIIIAKELHNLRYHDVFRTSGFIEVKNIRCLIGKYPQKLIEHWKTFDEEKKSDNDCPSMFDDNQIYIALELGHGGQDLEAFVFQNATEAYISFIQAALTLAVAEKSLDFEHRDLHWGNILISRTEDANITYKLNTEEIIFPCKGLKVAIIDFTLSRTSYQGCCIYNDLALDEALFTAVGDYQFEIYKLMRAKVGNNWQLFEPYTNILWLHYTLDKMINGVRYKKTTTKIHKNAILKLQELKDTLLDYDSAYDFIMNYNKSLGIQRRKLS